eukprot:403371085
MKIERTPELGFYNDQENKSIDKIRARPVLALSRKLSIRKESSVLTYSQDTSRGQLQSPMLNLFKKRGDGIVLKRGITNIDQVELNNQSQNIISLSNTVMNKEKKLLSKVIFKKAPIDGKINIPLLANFYSFLALAAQKETNGFAYLENDHDDPVMPRFTLTQPELAKVISPIRLTTHNRLRDIMRVVWSKEHGYRVIFNSFKTQIQMYLVSAIKSYDGQVNTGDSLNKPPKPLQENIAKHQTITDELLSKRVNSKDEPILNAQYIYELQQKLESQQEFASKAQSTVRQNKLQKLKFLYLQEEIDKIGYFQYQYCTSDKYPERNYIQEIARQRFLNSQLNFRPSTQYPEVVFQSETLLRLMNIFIKKKSIGRVLSLVCFDFIHDFTDSRWKFLTLKHFQSIDSITPILDIDLDESTRNHATQNIKSQSKLVKITKTFGVVKDHVNYLKRSKCNGEYCNVSDHYGYNMMPFGYLRDSMKILEIQKEQNKEIKVKNDERFMQKRKRRNKSEGGNSHNNSVLVPNNPAVPGTKSPTHQQESQRTYTLNNYDIYEDKKFHYRIMRRAIYVDRLRRKEILLGNLPDNEYFTTLDMDKKENNQNTFNDLLRLLYNDTSFLLLNEKTKGFNLNYYENAFLCCKCYRIYLFLTDTYAKQEETYQQFLQDQRMKNVVSKNSYFSGMNQQLNHKIINLVKDKMDSKVTSKEQEKRALLKLKLLSLSLAKQSPGRSTKRDQQNRSSADISKHMTFRKEQESPLLKSQKFGAQHRSSLAIDSQLLPSIKINVPSMQEHVEAEDNKQEIAILKISLQRPQRMADDLNIHKHKFISHKRFKTSVSTQNLTQSRNNEDLMGFKSSGNEKRVNFPPINSKKQIVRSNQNLSVQMPNQNQSQTSKKLLKIKKKSKDFQKLIQKKNNRHIKNLSSIYLAPGEKINLKLFNQSPKHKKQKPSDAIQVLNLESQSQIKTNDISGYSEDAFERYSQSSPFQNNIVKANDLDLNQQLMPFAQNNSIFQDPTQQTYKIIDSISPELFDQNLNALLQNNQVQIQSVTDHILQQSYLQDHVIFSSNENNIFKQFPNDIQSPSPIISQQDIPQTVTSFSNFLKQGSIKMLTQNQKIFEPIAETESIEDENYSKMLLTIREESLQNQEQLQIRQDKEQSLNETSIINDFYL